MSILSGTQLFFKKGRAVLLTVLQESPDVFEIVLKGDFSDFSMEQQAQVAKVLASANNLRVYPSSGSNRFLFI